MIRIRGYNPHSVQRGINVRGVRGGGKKEERVVETCLELPALRAAVKTELSYRIDTIRIVSFFAANKTSNT